MKRLVPALAAALLAPAVAAAQAWPQQPVKVIVPYSAGGTVDFSARALSQ